LSACENAYIEEQKSKARDEDKVERTKGFHNNTRMMLLEKMQEIEREK
jgi:hypothetical protein